MGVDHQQLRYAPMSLGGWEAGFQVELDRCFPGVFVGSFQGGSRGH